MNEDENSFEHAAPSARSVTTGASWVGAARLASALASLLSTAILARLLTPTDFGLIVIILVIANFALCFVEGGISLAVVQRPVLTNAYIQMALLLAGAMSFAAMALIAGGILVGRSYIDDEHVAVLLLVSLTAFPFRGWNSVLTAILQRKGEFRRTTIIAVVSGIAGYSLPAIVLAYLGFGVWALVGGFILSALAEFVLLARAVRTGVWRRPEWQLARDTRRVLGVGATLNLFNWAALNTPNLVVGALLGTATLGLFQRGSALVNLIKDVLGSSLARVLLPAFSSLHSDPERLRRAFEKSLAIGLPLFALASALTAIHAEPIVLLLLGPGWSETVPVLQLLSLGILPRVAYKITESIVVAKGDFASAAWRQLVYILLLVAFCATGSALPEVALGVTVATFCFYGLSLWVAARAANSALGGIALSHARALVVAAAVGGSDLLGIRAFEDVGFWASHVAGGLCGIAACVMIFLAPAWLAGPVRTEAWRALGAIRKWISATGGTTSNTSKIEVPPDLAKGRNGQEVG